jgi:hypothetical protein
VKINRINIEVSRLANKERVYLYNEMMTFARENKLGGTFGNDYINLSGVPENLTKKLEELEIKFMRIG